MTWGGYRLKRPHSEEARVLAPGSGRWRVPPRVADPAELVRPLRRSPHCPGWTASDTRLRRGRRASRPPHHGPRSRFSHVEDTEACEGCSAGRGVGGREAGADPGSPGSGNAMENRAGGTVCGRVRVSDSEVLRNSPRRTHGHEDGRPRGPENWGDGSFSAARPTRRRRPHRSQEGSGPEACQRLAAPRRVLGAGSQLGTLCCHVLRDPEACGGRLRHVPAFARLISVRAQSQKTR